MSTGRGARIRGIFRNAKHGLDALWAWAKGGSTRKGRKLRWRALTKWAKERRGATKGAVRRAWEFRRKTYRKKWDWFKHNHDPNPPPSTALIVTFDGRQVPAWIAAHLQAARNAGYWHGSVFSGYRTPAYSISLCQAMCGAPSCPGRCGGASSNHACPPSGAGHPYEGAVDITDAVGFQRYCRAHGNPLHGNGEMLPADTPHFSRSGR